MSPNSNPQEVMALTESSYIWRARSGLNTAVSVNTLRRKGVKLITAATIGKKRDCPSVRKVSSPFSLQLQKSSSLRSSWETQNGYVLTVKKGRDQHNCAAKKEKQEVNDENEDDGRDENGIDENGFGENGFDKYGYDKNGLNKYGLPRSAVLIDGPIRDPGYISYIDPNTGEPEATFGARAPHPNALFWGDDLADVQKAARESRFVVNKRVAEVRDAPFASDAPERGPQNVATSSGRRKKKSSTSPSTVLGSRAEKERSQKELAKRARFQSLKEKWDNYRAEQEKEKSVTQVVEDSKLNVKPIGTRNDEGKRLKKEDDIKSTLERIKDYKPEKKPVATRKGEGTKVEEEEAKDMSLLNVMAEKGYALIRGDASLEDNDAAKPLTNEELWWNWQKHPPDEEPWSAWQKPQGDSDAVMAQAMAETGQIKLFGEKPSLAEMALARARRHVFYNERIEAEEKSKQELGALAYYKEWVKAFKGHTSKEAVQKHFEETGETESVQLVNMFSYQTLREFRKMQGTDIRIRRDPLTMRMRPEQIKQVWGGDPVYPTINYVQDPDSVYDYRNENMHEPIPDILETLRESGRLITQAELKELLEQEKLEEAEFDEFDSLSGAVDIGEEDDEDDNDDDDEFEVEQPGGRSRIATANSKKSSPAKKVEVVKLDEEEIDEEEM